MLLDELVVDSPLPLLDPPRAMHNGIRCNEEGEDADATADTAAPQENSAKPRIRAMIVLYIEKR